MFLEWWMIGMLLAWWLMSVYAISVKEREKFFNIGLSAGIAATIDYINPKSVPTHDEIKEYIIDAIKEGDI